MRDVSCPPHVFSGVPSFFRACCRDVKNRTVPASYAHAARELIGNIGGLVPYGIEEGEWADRLERLADLIDRGSDDGVLEWLIEHFPNCLALVPKRRRGAFLQGVYEAAEEFGVSL